MTKRPKPALNRREQCFVAEYMVDLNATQAAIRAGYSPHTAGSQGHDLLKKPDIAAALTAAFAARAERTGITQDRVVHELALLAFSDLTHYVVTDDGDVALAEGAPATAMRGLQAIKRRITTRMVGGVVTTTREVELRLWDKPGPLKLAGQHVDLFREKLEHSGRLTLEQLLSGSWDTPGDTSER